MNTSLHPLRRLRYLGAVLLLSGSLAACNSSTGNEPGDVNVERDDNKQSDPGNLHPTGGVDSARILSDTVTTKQERQYDNARDNRDRDRDGKADQ